jgi:hypothetical protein
MAKGSAPAAAEIGGGDQPVFVKKDCSERPSVRYGAGFARDKPVRSTEKFSPDS